MTELRLETSYPTAQGLERPWPYYARLRADAPVEQVSTDPPIFLVSRYEDVRFVFQAPELFSSRGSRSALNGVDALIGTAETRIVSEADPPALRAKRDLGRLAITPGRLRGYEAMITDVADGLIDSFVDAGRCNFVDAFAGPLPREVMCRLFDLPPEDWAWVREWATLEAAGLAWMPKEFRASQLDRAQRMSQYLVALILERHESPRTDMVSEIVGAQVARDGTLDLDELTSLLSALLLGGVATTTNALGSAMLLLLENPEAVARVRASPELIPRMTEEALRLEPPVLWQPRRVTRQTELAGVLLPEGATLLLLQGSANYDEATFTCPAGFDVERENVREHVTFGYGPHTCLGAPLARLELRIAFARLLGRLDDIRLAEDNDLRHIESPKIRGLRSLNIEYKRRSQA